MKEEGEEEKEDGGYCGCRGGATMLGGARHAAIATLVQIRAVAMGRRRSPRRSMTDDAHGSIVDEDRDRDRVQVRRRRRRRRERVSDVEGKEGGGDREDPRDDEPSHSSRTYPSCPTLLISLRGMCVCVCVCVMGLILKRRARAKENRQPLVRCYRFRQ